jgi:hypothetical protein
MCSAIFLRITLNGADAVRSPSPKAGAGPPIGGRPAVAAAGSLGRFGALHARGRRRDGATFDRAQNVVLGDPPADPRSGNRADVDVMLAGDAPDQRRRT